MSTTGENAAPHGAHGGGAMSARLRAIACETEGIVEAGRYRAPAYHEVSIVAPGGGRPVAPACTARTRWTHRRPVR